MHEMSLCHAIAEIVVDEARAAGAAGIRRVTLEIGVAAPVEIEAIRFCLPLCLADTVAAEAELKIERPPLEIRCDGCGAIHHPPRATAPCPVCGAVGGDILSGRQMRVVALEAV